MVKNVSQIGALLSVGWCFLRCKRKKSIFLCIFWFHEYLVLQDRFILKTYLRPDFTSKLVDILAFGTPKFYIAPYDKIKHELVNLSSNCDVKSGLRLLGIAGDILYDGEASGVTGVESFKFLYTLTFKHVNI